jgi:hypothetical protein
LVLQYVQLQTPEICLEAIKDIGYAIKYVLNQTPEIIYAAKYYKQDLKRVTELDKYLTTVFWHRAKFT